MLLWLIFLCFTTVSPFTYLIRTVYATQYRGAVSKTSSRGSVVEFGRVTFPPQNASVRAQVPLDRNFCRRKLCTHVLICWLAKRYPVLGDQVTAQLSATTTSQRVWAVNRVVKVDTGYVQRFSWPTDYTACGAHAEYTGDDSSYIMTSVAIWVCGTTWPRNRKLTENYLTSLDVILMTLLTNLSVNKWTS